MIEKLEKTRLKDRVMDLEEQRVIWHNKLIQILKRERTAADEKNAAKPHRLWPQLFAVVYALGALL